MKAFYLTVALILTVLILVVSFENSASQCSALSFLFMRTTQNTTVVMLGIAVLGVITGFLYRSFLGLVFDSKDEEEDDDF
jgi:uncharacterized integral membrane protein